MTPQVLGFVEGVWPPRCGLGLVAVPEIFASIAARGLSATLLVSGRVPSPDPIKLRRHSSTAPAGAGALTITEFDAYTKWAFSPSVIWPAVKATRGADVVSLHSLYSFPVLLGYLLAKWAGKPYILWPLGVLAPFQRQVGAAKKWFYDRLFARRILQSAAAIVYTAAAERKEAEYCAPPVPSLVIPHGIAIDEFTDLPDRGAFRAAYLSGFTGPLITYLGRLNAKKGLDILVESFIKLVPRFSGEVRLAIIGPPDPSGFENPLRAMLRGAGVERLAVFTGPINTPSSKLQALVDTDVFAVPSIAENFCFSMFEAMACRIPVVVSDTINFAPKVAAYGAGLVVDRSADSFANALEAVLLNPARQAALGSGGRRLAEAYSWTACGRRLDLALQAILNRQPFPPDLTDE